MGPVGAGGLIVVAEPRDGRRIDAARRYRGGGGGRLNGEAGDGDPSANLRIKVVVIVVIPMPNAVPSRRARRS